MVATIKLNKRTTVIGAAVAVSGAAILVSIASAMSSRVRNRVQKTKSTLAYYTMRAAHRVNRTVSWNAAPASGDADMSEAWLTRVMRKSGSLGGAGRVKRAEIGNELTGGFHGGGSLKRVSVEYEGESEGPPTVMLKTCWEGLDKHLQSVHHGLAREALCYDWLGRQPYLPVIHYSWGSMLSGAYTMVMEDLSDATLCTLYFGNQWRGVSDALACPADSKLVLQDAFERIAQFHATHWTEGGKVGVRHWMRGAEWCRGRGRQSWEANVAWARSNWMSARDKIVADSSKEGGLKFSAKIVKAIDESFKWTTWERAKEHFKSCTTLIHGDFHGQNVFYRHSGTERSVLIDWAMVGPGLPLQDLGQFMVSDVTPKLRREVEEDVVKAYWARLIALGVDAETFTFKQCWANYQRACVGKWLWMIALLSSWNLPTVTMQYFHDQLLAFIDDHAGEDLRFYVGV